jgi:3-deoxy-D-manno-octulosonic-acid transferase
MNVSRSWALQGYLWLAKAMKPVWRWALQKRLQRGKETPESLAQKWVTDPPNRPQGPLIWGHAVGVGEAMALAGLFAQMGAHWPQAHFLITTTARTSGDALHKTGLPPRCIHQFAPVDTPETVGRFLDHWQPSLAVWCELDLWPALIHATAQRGIAHALVNARLDARALAKRRWGRFIYRALLPGFGILWAQNTATRDGLIQLGARPERVVVTGTIKAMSPPLACDATQLQAWQQVCQSRPVWLLASSHPGEEALALQAHDLLRQQHPGALLVIAPRAPTRGMEILALCPSGTLLRSASSTLPTPSDTVYVADTIGEMGLWFRLAPVAMLGGSWAQVGGHNPHEPLALGCRVLHGPHVGNFAESYSDLDGQGLSQLVIETTDMAHAVNTTWAQPSTQTTAQPHQARELLESLIRLARA